MILLLLLLIVVLQLAVGVLLAFDVEDKLAAVDVGDKHVGQLLEYKLLARRAEALLLEGGVEDHVPRVHGKEDEGCEEREEDVALLPLNLLCRGERVRHVEQRHKLDDKVRR